MDLDRQRLAGRPAGRGCNARGAGRGWGRPVAGGNLRGARRSQNVEAMNTPASALAWEIGRKNRWGFLLVLASLLCGLVVRLSGATEGEVVQSVAGIAMMVSFLVTFAISTYADSGAQISFPTRTFALPVRTGLLVNGVVFFGALAITVIHLAWAYLFLLPLDAHYPLGSFTIYWVAALVTFQAIGWNLAEHPKSFVAVLLIMMTLYVRLAALLL